jgi:hypothetical protein
LVAGEYQKATYTSQAMPLSITTRGERKRREAKRSLEGRSTKFKIRVFLKSPKVSERIPKGISFEF